MEVKVIVGELVAIERGCGRLLHASETRHRCWPVGWMGLNLTLLPA